MTVFSEQMFILFTPYLYYLCVFSTALGSLMNRKEVGEMVPAFKLLICISHIEQHDRKS